MKRQSPCIHYGQIRSDAGLFLCYNISIHHRQRAMS
nr:MAG TPA: hypothetical protein [Caudoviricetes sp.]DAJ71279.1 MAG TPA: hypothetical protein [Caudoviricetes sp.]DAK31629.1 MAG TPA: hypothetical protein [Caudoviricetes sp.]DAK43118.1 MAG TPA: hypothetical protein [Caudoviricetes sp.]DAX60404.1 MAG TPA: hypothetical protein [Caudoviricetes sp.]